jgi:hypothetical protein
MKLLYRVYLLWGKSSSNNKTNNDIIIIIIIIIRSYHRENDPPMIGRRKSKCRLGFVTIMARCVIQIQGYRLSFMTV